MQFSWNNMRMREGKNIKHGGEEAKTNSEDK
jgi:hypothetical protein